MTTTMLLVAVIAVFVMICPVAIVLAFLAMTNDVPRVGQAAARRDQAISIIRLVLLVVLVAALISVGIRFLA